MVRKPTQIDQTATGSPTTKRQRSTATANVSVPSAATNDSASKRAYLRQSDVPSSSLDDALRVPQAIFDHYAGKPVSPLFLAKALNVDPKGSQLRLLTGAAIAFGLIEGGAQATTISATPLAQRIMRPTKEDEELTAKREAVLKPRVFGDFLRQYDGHPFPRLDIAINVLEQMDVPRAKAEEVLERIDQSARSVGFLEQIRDKVYVSLDGSPAEAAKESTSSAPPANLAAAAEPSHPEEKSAPQPETSRRKLSPTVPSGSGKALSIAFADDQRRRRVFITHGKKRELVEPIKKLLEYGELEPVVSVDRQSVSKPVPEKFMDDMRGCGAAIIHVDAERVLFDKEGNEHVILNPNVLIEIGAAMAFYGRRFILLVKEGVKLPSNLQGLYEVRYDGNVLDAAATIKLLEAMKDIKNYQLPSEQDA